MSYLKFNLLFWINKQRSKNIYLRITVDGLRAELCTGLYVAPKKWSPKTWVKGSTPEARAVNTRLKDLYDEIQNIAYDRIDNNLAITPNILKQIYLGEGTPDSQKEIKVMEAFDLAFEIRKKNDQLSASSEILAKHTIKTIKKFVDNKPIIPAHFHNIDKNFAISFANYMVENGLKYSTRNGCFNQASILFNALQDAGLFKVPDNNPFNTKLIKRTVDETVKGEEKYLSPGDFKKIKETKLSGNIEYYRHAFLFQCYTGMGYSELIVFDPNVHIMKDIEGMDKIRISRKKTRRSSTKICEIPMLEETKECIRYFKEFPITIGNSVQHYNNQLKKMSEELGITRLHSHRGRHTFGTHMLTRGFSMESVSYMLGHSDPAITAKIYAKISSSKINLEYQKIKAG